MPPRLRRPRFLLGSAVVTAALLTGAGAGAHAAHQDSVTTYAPITQTAKDEIAAVIQALHIRGQAGAAATLILTQVDATITEAVDGINTTIETERARLEEERRKKEEEERKRREEEERQRREEEAQRRRAEEAARQQEAQHHTATPAVEAASGSIEAYRDRCIPQTYLARAGNIPWQWGTINGRAGWYSGGTNPVISIDRNEPSRTNCNVAWHEAMHAVTGNERPEAWQHLSAAELESVTDCMAELAGAGTSSAGGYGCQSHLRGVAQQLINGENPWP